LKSESEESMEIDLVSQGSEEEVKEDMDGEK
jgi:hypothetical protein